MRLIAVMTLLLIGTANFASAENLCGSNDGNFSSFLERFKNDDTFQKSRIIFPLKMTSTEPDGLGNIVTEVQNLSLNDIKDKSIQIIIGKHRAEELMGGEGRLCEQGPEVNGDRATFMQYSCNTDVYGYEYEFVFKSGCWFLQSFSTSGY